MTALNLQGRTALVTGGFSGLGRHFAGVLAANGARVAIVGRRIALGREAAAEIDAAIGGAAEVRAYQADVTDGRSVANAFKQAKDELGVATIVVNNAGTVARAPSIELADADWSGVVDVNLSGVFRVAQAAAREMVTAG